MKRVCLVAVVIALLVWWLVPVPAQTMTFYVRTDGHDTASGENNTADPTTGAWLTIGKCASTLTAGQTCLVADGTYNETVSERSNGTDGHPITYRAINQHGAVVNGFTVGSYSSDGNYVTVDGFKIMMPDSAQFGFWVNGAHDVIQNNWVTSQSSALGANNTALQIENGSSYITATRNRLERTCFGVILYGASNTLSYNWITDLRVPTADLEGPPFACGDADYIRMFQDGHQILYNSMYGTDWDLIGGPIGGAHVDCIQTFDNAYSSSNILIEGNYCNDPHQGLMLGNSIKRLSTSWVIRNNVFARVRTWCMDAFAIADMHIYNNSCYIQMTPGSASNGHGFECRFPEASCEFKNNIIYHGSVLNSSSILYTFSDGAVYIDGDASAPGENNILYAPGLTITGFAEDIINVDPQFVDLTNRNLHLKTTSPARNAGQTIAGWTSPTDRDGLTRPQQTNFAIGAYEWTGVPSSPVALRIQ